MKNWISAFRPKTLTAVLVPIIVGTALAQAHDFQIEWWVTVFTLFSALAIQIATNLFNDAIDFKKGADTSERLGPKRIALSGEASVKTVQTVAFVFLILAFLLGVPLVIRGGELIVFIGILSLFLAYGYTGGPWPLAYKGLGDIFVILFFGLIAVFGIYYLYTKTWNLSVIVAGLQTGFLCTVLIAINNARDIEQDKKANKLTLPVRFGLSFVRAEIFGLIASSFLGLIYWWLSGQTLAALLPLLLLPLAFRLVYQIYVTPPSAAYNTFLAKSALLHLGFGVLLSLGLVLG